jgi:glycosyltransferase involved in cell wall biosynthesis
MTQKPKIAIIHDAFLYRGGGERLVTLMAKSLDADLISGFFSEGSFDPRELGYEGKIISLGKPVFTKGIRHLVLKWRFFWKARILKDYDIVIFSGDCLGALRHVRKSITVKQYDSMTGNREEESCETVNLWNHKTVYYCHTPPRYLFDFREKYLSSLPFFLRPFFDLAFRYFAWVYKKRLTQFDQIFTNSENVQKRLKDFTGYGSKIIYPPTDTSRFTPMSSTVWQYDSMTVQLKFTETVKLWNCETPYFLSFARLSPPKRVEIIIDTFLQMPEKNLVFCYGKNDPLKDQILEKVKGKSHIIPLEAPEDDVLISLIQGAIATIYIPVDEDFGMSPVESMACGTPVIGVAEWGLLETMIEGKTGKLIQIRDAVSGVQNLKKVLLETKEDEWKNMNNACRERAEEFSLEKFQERLQSSLNITV